MDLDRYDILVACEFSGTVRDAFIDEGYDAISCDLRPSETSGPHIEGDAIEVLESSEWDGLIAHPPCTYLCNSGVRWLHERDDRWQDMIDGAVFFRRFLEADVPHIAVENPIMHKYARKIVGENYTQKIQPYQFGVPETKATCFWMKGLPPLEPTDKIPNDEVNDSIHKMPPSDDRSKKRSVFFDGVAEAMAEQWGPVIDR